MHYSDISVFPPIIAHRGRSALAPENTLIAFLKAKECGLRWIEFDVTLASCGEVVVIHDDELQRTTTGIGRVIDFAYESLKELDAGSWFAPEFAGQKISTLREVLLFLKEHHMAGNIEIKAYPNREEWVAKRVLEEIKTYGSSDIPLLVTSFSKPMLRQVRTHDREIPLGFLMSRWDKNFNEFCDELGAINIGINHKSLSLERVKQLKSTGRLLFAYTVNDVARAKELFSFGVDAIFSDYPETMLLCLDAD